MSSTSRSIIPMQRRLLFLKNRLFSKIRLFSKNKLFSKLESSLFLENCLFLEYCLFLENSLFLENCLFLKYCLFLEYVIMPLVGKFAHDASCASSFLAAGVAQEVVVVNSARVLSSRVANTAHADMWMECFISARESMNAQ